MLARASAVFSGVLLIAMIGLQCFIVVGAVGAVRQVRRVVLPIGEGVSGELPAFRWETGREASHDRQGSRLYRWDAYGRPQVRRA